MLDLFDDISLRGETAAYRFYSLIDRDGDAGLTIGVVSIIPKAVEWIDAMLSKGGSQKSSNCKGMPFSISYRTLFSVLTPMISHRACTCAINLWRVASWRENLRSNAQAKTISPGTSFQTKVKGVDTLFCLAKTFVGLLEGEVLFLCC
jgi:hypothetical protein